MGWKSENKIIRKTFFCVNVRLGILVAGNLNVYRGFKEPSIINGKWGEKMI